MENLTQEEKYVVARYLSSGSPLDFYGYVAAYISPTLLMFGYGLYHMEPIAVSLGYIGLLVIAIWYLRYSEKTTRPLNSALRKYEQAANALATINNDD